jgi:hypothetical protein
VQRDETIRPTAEHEVEMKRARIGVGKGTKSKVLNAPPPTVGTAKTGKVLGKAGAAGERRSSTSSDHVTCRNKKKRPLSTLVGGCQPS